MPLSPQPLPPSDHSSPDETLQGFREWSRHVGDPEANTTRAQDPFAGLPTVALGHPLVLIAAVGFIGYTLGRLIHGRT